MKEKNSSTTKVDKKAYPVNNKKKVAPSTAKATITPVEKMKLKMPYYLIFVFASFATIPALYYNISTEEASYLYFFSESIYGSTLISYINSTQLVESKDLAIVFRFISIIFTSVSAIFFYRLVRKMGSNLVTSMVALISFLINPIVQIVYVSSTPLSLITLFAMFVLSIYVSGLKGSIARVTILSVAILSLVIILSFISLFYFIFFILILLSIAVSYSIAKYYSRIRFRNMIYILLALFVLSNIYMRVFMKDVIFISDEQDFSTVSEFVNPMIMNGDMVAMKSLDDASLLNYYLGFRLSTISIDDINSEVGRKFIILEEPLDEIKDSMIGIVSRSIDGIRSKYYVYFM